MMKATLKQDLKSGGNPTSLVASREWQRTALMLPSEIARTSVPCYFILTYSPVTGKPPLFRVPDRIKNCLPSRSSSLSVPLDNAES